VKALAARRFAEGQQAELLESLAYLERGRDDGIEFHVRRRIQVEDQSPGDLRIVGCAVPGMEFQRSHLSDGGQRFDPIDLHVGGPVAPHLDQFKQLGHAGHGMTLKELLAADPVRCAHEGTRAAGQVRHHPSPTLSK